MGTNEGPPDPTTVLERLSKLEVKHTFVTKNNTYDSHAAYSSDALPP